MAKRTKIGEVISAKMDKTVVVSVPSVKVHPIYKKRYTINTKFKAHDEKKACKRGDKVQIEEGRPLSKTKKWAVKKILEEKE